MFHVEQYHMEQKSNTLFSCVQIPISKHTQELVVLPRNRQCEITFGKMDCRRGNHFASVSQIISNFTGHFRINICVCILSCVFRGNIQIIIEVIENINVIFTNRFQILHAVLL